MFIFSENVNYVFFSENMQQVNTNKKNHTFINSISVYDVPGRSAVPGSLWHFLH